MKVHHLNCGTMCARGGRLVLGKPASDLGSVMVCHCMLIETPSDGLVLVDTGVGLEDLAAPGKRLGRVSAFMLNLRREEAATAARQVEALGYSRDDVRHIVVTHLDLDHAGGLPDFPNATVHIYAAEHDAAMEPATSKEKGRYRHYHWDHGPRWERYEDHGEPWYGFDAVRGLRGLPPEVLLVPLIGHTRGHCGVAVDTDDGWLLHCGDAYFHHREMDHESPGCPGGLRLFQKIVQMDKAARLANQDRLRELVRDHGSEIQVFSAHDAYEYDRMTQGLAPR